MNFSDLLHNKKDCIRIILDECKLYLDESLPSAMVRGEVIVNFPKETPIQGPIEVIFEGIQRFLPWSEIMRYRALGDPIETKLQVIELSLLPPSSNGLMPAGIQRFPFEFPVPTNLPATISIKDRIEIFYQISAIVRRSSQNISDSRTPEGLHLFDRVRKVTMKKRFVACEQIRIVRSVESVVSRNFIRSITSAFRGENENATETPSMTSSSVNELDSEDDLTTAQSNPLVNSLPWNMRNLDYYQGSLDEQHDSLASSLSGKSSDNLSSPMSALDHVFGVRYKLGIDRTAIVLGTSIGVELMIAPTVTDVIIRSISLKIAEKRKYSIKIPANHNWDTKSPETRRTSESATIVMKWAYGYQLENKYEHHKTGKIIKEIGTRAAKTSSRFVHQICDEDLNSVYPGIFKADSGSKKECIKGDTTVRKNAVDSSSVGYEYEESAFLNNDAGASNEIFNMKELNQDVKTGEYFGGRFVLPVPECDNLLHPSMLHDSLDITHWSTLVVTLESNGKLFDIKIESPMHVLNCRLVATGDECQTILPPPPSYDPSKESHCENSNYPGSIWEQREKITSEVNWGCCIPCPCEYKKLLKEKKIKKIASRNSISLSTTTPYPSTFSPEWGPPPMYSEN